jgi:hypothetical protein
MDSSAPLAREKFSLLASQSRRGGPPRQPAKSVFCTLVRYRCYALGPSGRSFFLEKCPPIRLWLDRLPLPTLQAPSHPPRRSALAGARRPRTTLRPVEESRGICALPSDGALNGSAPTGRSSAPLGRASGRTHAADPEEHPRRARVATVWEQRRGEQRGRPGALPLPTTPERLHFAGWPADVEIERQRWTMAFDSTGEWLEKRVALAPALAEGFRRPWKPHGKPPRSRLELHPERGRGAPSLPRPRIGPAARAARSRPLRRAKAAPALRLAPGPRAARPNTGRNGSTSGPRNGRRSTTASHCAWYPAAIRGSPNPSSTPSGNNSSPTCPSLPRGRAPAARHRR